MISQESNPIILSQAEDVFTVGKGKVETCKAYQRYNILLGGAVDYFSTPWSSFFIYKNVFSIPPALDFFFPFF